LGANCGKKGGDENNLPETMGYLKGRENLTMDLRGPNGGLTGADASKIQGVLNHGGTMLIMGGKQRKGYVDRGRLRARQGGLLPQGQEQHALPASRGVILLDRRIDEGSESQQNKRG